jgi:hypothetical protein
MRPPFLFFGGFVSSLLLAGCGSIGPASIRGSRAAYNQAVQQTNDQELLTNLVRIRYRDTLYFTSVERIAATQELNESFGVAAGETRLENSFAGAPAGTAIVRTLTRPFTLGPAVVSVNEKPTIFYTPVEGEKFVRQMMTPMNPEMLLLLVKSGWSLDRVFALGVQEMNGLKNAPTASGPTPSREPEFRDFREATRLLRSLQRTQQLDLVKAAGSDSIELRFTRGSGVGEEAARLKQLLGLAADKDRFRLTPGSEAPNNESIALSTRPLLSAMTYLSQGVEAPEQDFAAGRVRRTTRENGQPFDWQEMLGDLFRVQASDRAPADTSVAIRYRGSYFFIADNDLDSKSTFVLLTQLIALHSVPAGNSPAMSFSFGK